VKVSSLRAFLFPEVSRVFSTTHSEAGQIKKKKKKKGTKLRNSVLTMFATAVNPQSFSTPGWQIEKNYSTRVLTGNWVEERKKVRRK
jgi:hypothetical protein